MMRHRLHISAVLCGVVLSCTNGEPSSSGATKIDSDTPVIDSGQADSGRSPELAVVTTSPGAPCEEVPTAWPMQRWNDTAWQSQSVTPETGPFPTSAWGLAIADFNGDTLLDIFLPQLGGSQLFLNQGERVFINASPTHLPGGATTALAATPVDLDGDGDLDIAETGFGMIRLLLNDGNGTFTPESPINADSATLYLGSSWADMDGDGDLDGIIAAFPTTIPSMEEREDPAHIPGAADILIESTESGWVDASDRLPSTNDGHTFLSAWQDLNGDMQPELLIMNDYFITGRTNRVWSFNGSAFTDTSDEYGLNQRMESMGLAITDFNRDQIPDFLITGWGELAWMVSDSGSDSWVDRRAADGYTLATADGQWVGWGAEFADLDNDRSEEAIVSFGYWELAGEEDDVGHVNALEQPDAVYSMIDGVAEDQAALWGMDDRSFGRGLVTADIDRDGRIDVARRPVFGIATIDSPRCSSDGWATVSLLHPSKNRFAIGARISLESDTHVQTRWIRSGGTGLAGGGPPEAHFGLGNSTSIQRITVAWPDGVQTTHDGIAGNQHITISRLEDDAL